MQKKVAVKKASSPKFNFIELLENKKSSIKKQQAPTKTFTSKKLLERSSPSQHAEHDESHIERINREKNSEEQPNFKFKGSARRMLTNPQYRIISAESVVYPNNTEVVTVTVKNKSRPMNSLLNAVPLIYLAILIYIGMLIKQRVVSLFQDDLMVTLNSTLRF